MSARIVEFTNKAGKIYNVLELSEDVVSKNGSPYTIRLRLGLKKAQLVFKEMEAIKDFVR